MDDLRRRLYAVFAKGAVSMKITDEKRMTILQLWKHLAGILNGRASRKPPLVSQKLGCCRCGRANAAAVESEQKKTSVVGTTVRPNIVLYLADQRRWDFVGANGRNSSTRTPNLDALAAQGKNFTHTVATSPYVLQRVRIYLQTAMLRTPVSGVTVCRWINLFPRLLANGNRI